MLQPQALLKLLQGKSLYQQERKEVLNLLSNPPSLKIPVFVEPSKQEISIFKKYIKNASMPVFFTRYQEGLPLLFKQDLTPRERRKLAIFTLINRLMQRIELENNFKTTLYKKLDEIEAINPLQASSKKRIVDMAIDFGITVLAHNKK